MEFNYLQGGHCHSRKADILQGSRLLDTYQTSKDTKININGELSKEPVKLLNHV